MRRRAAARSERLHGNLPICSAQDRAAADRVTAGESIEWAAKDAGIVIEAALEHLPLKRAIFAELERAAPADAILASNTSALPITRISEGLKTRHRIVGSHFLESAASAVPLVEIVLMGPENRPAADRLATLLRTIGRHPVLVHRDIPGFIGNRFAACNETRGDCARGIRRL